MYVMMRQSETQTTDEGNPTSRAGGAFPENTLFCTPFGLKPEIQSGLQSLSGLPEQAIFDTQTVQNPKKNKLALPMRRDFPELSLSV